MNGYTEANRVADMISSDAEITRAFRGPSGSISRIFMNYSDRPVYFCDKRIVIILDPTTDSNNVILKRPNEDGKLMYYSGALSDHIRVPLDQYPYAGMINGGMNTIRTILQTFPWNDWEYVKVPTPGSPTVVQGLGGIVFYSMEEIISKKEEFGSLANLVDAYTRSYSTLITGAYRVITRFTKKPIFFTDGSGTVHEIPRANDTMIEKYCRMNGIDIEEYGDDHMVVVVTVSDNGTKRPVITSIKHHKVPYNPKHSDKPVIGVEHGLPIFTTRENATAFGTKYQGKVLEYLVEEAMMAAEKDFAKEIERLKQQTKKQGAQVFEVVALMGLSAIIGAVTQFGLEYLVSRIKPSKETAKKFIGVL